MQTKLFTCNLVYLRGLDITYLGPFYFYDKSFFLEGYQLTSERPWYSSSVDKVLEHALERVKIGEPRHRVKMYMEFYPIVKYQEKLTLPGYTLKRLPSINQFLEDQLHRTATSRKYLDFRASANIFDSYPNGRIEIVTERSKAKDFLGIVQKRVILDKESFYALLLDNFQVNNGLKRSDCPNLIFPWYCKIALELELRNLRNKKKELLN